MSSYTISKDADGNIYVGGELITDPQLAESARRILDALMKDSKRDARAAARRAKKADKK